MLHRRLTPLERIYRGPAMSFVAMGRADAGIVVPDVPYAVISVTDPHSPDADLAESPLRQAVLRLKFHDTADEGDPPPGTIVISERDAEAILDFFETHRPQVQLIVCHCEAGASRSPGIAAALSRLVQDEDLHFFTNYAPNLRVYQAILDRAAARAAWPSGLPED